MPIKWSGKGCDEDWNYDGDCIKNNPERVGKELRKKATKASYICTL